MVEIKFQSKTKKRYTSVAYIDGETIGNVQLCKCLTFTANLCFLLVAPLSQRYMFYIVGIERVKIRTKAEKGTFFIRQTLFGRVYRELQVRFSNGLRKMFHWLVLKPHSVNFTFDVLYVSLMLNTRCCKCVSLTFPSRFTSVCVRMFVCVCVCVLARLQRVQKNAARLVLKRKRDQVTPLLKELHWLPVKFRCQYKIATLAYRHCDGSLPHYLSSSLCTYELSRSLRSSKENAKNSKAKSQVIWTTFFQFHGTISLEFSAGHSKKCTNTVSGSKRRWKTLFAQPFL